MFWKLLFGQLTSLALLALAMVFFGFPMVRSTLLAESKQQLQALGTSIQAEWSVIPADAPSSAERLARRNQQDLTLQLLPPMPGRDQTSVVESRSPESGQPTLVLTQPLANADGKPAGLLVATKSLKGHEEFLARLRSMFGWSMAGSVAVACITSAFMAGRWSKRLQSLWSEMIELVDDPGHASTGRSTVGRDPLHQLARTWSEAKSLFVQKVEGIDQVRKDLQTMLETIPEAVLAIDDEQRILFANASTYRLFSLPSGNISGQKLWAILRQPGLQDAVSMTFASREPTTSEFEIRRPPRVVRYFGRGLAVGSGRGIIIVLHDISELRRLERLRQDFFASVSHELKTPLAAIKAYTETLLDDEVHDRSVSQRFLKRIEEQADRLHTLVIDMLMLARVESEDHGFDIVPLDVRPSILTSVESFREKAVAKGVEIETSLIKDPLVILADAEGMGMIVRNLVDNAVKYTSAGGKVRVTTTIGEGNLQLQVADTGVGIPPDDLNRIFERFYRVDKARSRELGGTGLGLSIVKHLVQRFGGAVSVRSRLNEGSTFTVSLPLAVGRLPLKQGQGLVEQETNA